MLTLDRLTTADAEYKATRQALTRIAFDLEKIRTGHDLHPEFRLSSHHVTPFSEGELDVDPDSEEAATYPAGTTVLVASLHHARWGDMRNVIIPVSYLDGTDAYRSIETAAHAKRHLDIKARAASQATMDEEEALRQRRATYEQLHAEFGGDPSQA